MAIIPARGPTPIVSRRGLLTGIAALGALALSGFPSRAATLPAQSLSTIGGIPISSQDLLFYWGPFQAGDQGEPVQVYAYERFAWHFTGYPAGNIVTNPNVPIMSDRSITVLGTNDNVCWGPIFTLNAVDPAGMNARTDDPLRVSHDDGAYLEIRPQAGGSVNPSGPDCGLLLFCSKLFGPRS